MNGKFTGLRFSLAVSVVMLIVVSVACARKVDNGLQNDIAAESVPPDQAEDTKSADDIAGDSAECIVTPPENPVACTMEYAPVCGCDGKTYSNACVAHAAGVPHSTPGACDARDQF